MTLQLTVVANDWTCYHTTPFIWRVQISGGLAGLACLNECDPFHWAVGPIKGGLVRGRLRVN